jgi:hypothetical protein
MPPSWVIAQAAEGSLFACFNGKTDNPRCQYELCDYFENFASIFTPPSWFGRLRKMDRWRHFKILEHGMMATPRTWVPIIRHWYTSNLASTVPG